MTETRRTGLRASHSDTEWRKEERKYRKLLKGVFIMLVMISTVASNKDRNPMRPKSFCCPFLAYFIHSSMEAQSNFADIFFPSTVTSWHNLQGEM